ncbi:hypothetical protein [Galbitalea sp. SE-J8]|uniref:hypothetical protein n=1 Tax=Galbitalea sp. SE-J8 TaxID=3054952 RepID=UPI00259CA0B1|nr:hypothetical protein [Galbitalea sp. SE-J8]
MPALAILLTVSGCAGRAGSPGAEGTDGSADTPSASATSTPALTPTPTPTSTPTSTGIDATSISCSDLLSPDSVDSIESDGYTLSGDEFAASSVAAGNVFGDFVEFGGVACDWVNTALNTHCVSYAFAPLSEDAASKYRKKIGLLESDRVSGDDHVAVYNLPGSSSSNANFVFGNGYAAYSVASKCASNHVDEVFQNGFGSSS